MSSFLYALIHEEDGAYGISFPDFSGLRIRRIVARRGTGARPRNARISYRRDGRGRRSVPRPRRLHELKTDPTFVEDADGAAIVAVPIEVPARAVRVNVSIDERLLEAIDRAAHAAGQSRSAFLAEAARTRIKGAT